MAGGTPVSPYTYEAKDYQDAVIRGVFNYDNATRELLSLQAHRDAGCLYTKIVVGFGGDGSVETSTRKVTVPVGDTNITKAQLNSVGLTTIDDILSLQITAIP